MSATLVRSVSAGHLPPIPPSPKPWRSWSADNLASLEVPPTRYHTPCPHTPKSHSHGEISKSPSPAPEPPQAAVCEVCFEVQDTEWLWTCPDAREGHAVLCRWCVAQHVQAKLRTTYLVLVACPHPSCGHVLTAEDVEALTPGDWHGLADPYRQLVRRVAAARTATCAHCGHVNGRPAATCERCRAGRADWEEGSVPKTKVPMGQRLRVGLWLLCHAKGCPRCHTHIQKNGGCRHMTCTHCRHEFCWICKRPWAGHHCPAKVGLRVLQGTCLLLASPLWAPPVLVYVAGRWVRTAYKDAQWRRSTRPQRPPLLPLVTPQATLTATQTNRVVPYEVEPLPNYQSEGGMGFDVARVECVMRMWPPPHASEGGGGVHARAEGETRRRRLAERRVWRPEAVGV